MSLDYPYYEELVRRRHPGRWWWIVGDRLYYLGLVGGIIAMVVSILLKLRGVPCVVLVVVFPASFITGVLCKRWSYVLGKRDGIDADSY